MEKQTDGVNSIKLTGEIAYPPKSGNMQNGVWGNGLLKTAGKGGFIIGFVTYDPTCVDQIKQLRERDTVTLHGCLRKSKRQKDGKDVWEFQIIVDQIDVIGPTMGWKQPERTNWSEKPAELSRPTAVEFPDDDIPF